MTAGTARHQRRLGVFSLGFLWQPALRRALSTAGWDVCAGAAGADAIGVWGRRGVAWRGASMARRTGKPLITLEDGYLRSIHPGAKSPVISLIIDDIGFYYDASSPSRLEQLIAEGAGDVERARRGIDRLRSTRLSKYNHAPDMAKPPQGHVLVVDQTRDDASVTWGGATEASFAQMLDAAKTDHPGTEIIIKRHPETASGAKRGYFNDVSGATTFADAVNPWDLIDGAKAVYTVSSQLGFEALIAGKPVRCFGSPFYAGWGATDDEAAIPRRDVARSTDQIFSAAYLDYPTYFDPWNGGLSSFEAACDALQTLRTAHRRNTQPTVCSGVRLWKRKYVSAFLQGPGASVRYENNAQKASALATSLNARHVVWGTAESEGASQLEDGFLRSAGLGAALTPPLSLALDDEGIYYDPTRPSDLERLIANAPTDEASLARAGNLRRRLIDLSLSKYNLKGQAFPRPDHPHILLAVGQVENDASIRKGASGIKTNLGLLEAARKAAPDAHIIYKPHPDIEAGLRPGAIAPDVVARLADDIAADVSAPEILGAVDEVWTITSLLGFEALLRGKKVVTFGAPFYAGWGLTEDHGEIPARRTARPSLDGLIHAALIDYPMYRDPVSGLPCEVEVIVERLAAGQGQAGALGRTLSKLQGMAASYAWLWR